MESPETSSIEPPRCVGLERFFPSSSSSSSAAATAATAAHELVEARSPLRGGGRGVRAAGEQRRARAGGSSSAPRRRRRRLCRSQRRLCRLPSLPPPPRPWRVRRRRSEVDLEAVGLGLLLAVALAVVHPRRVRGRDPPRDIGLLEVVRSLVLLAVEAYVELGGLGGPARDDSRVDLARDLEDGALRFFLLLWGKGREGKGRVRGGRGTSSKRASELSKNGRRQIGNRFNRSRVSRSSALRSANAGRTRTQEPQPHEGRPFGWHGALQAPGASVEFQNLVAGERLVLKNSLVFSFPKAAFFFLRSLAC